MYRSAKAQVLFKIEGESSAHAIACLGTASISSTMNIDSRDCIGASSPQKTAMSMDWTENFSGVADISKGGAQEALFNAYKKGARIQVVTIYAETPELDGYEGIGLLGDWSVNLTAPGVAEVTFTLQGTSELNIIHENSLGVAIVITNTNTEIMNGDAIEYRTTPQTGAEVTFTATPEGATFESKSNKIKLAETVKNGETVTVTAKLTKDTLTATDVASFIATGQKS